MVKKLGIVAVTVGLFAFAVPLFAHHGTASFDTTKTLSMTAEEVFKNIQVLKGIPVDQFLGAMA
jgi:hypothetical protein